MRKKFTVLDLIFSIGHNSDDIPVTVKTSREEVGTAPSLRWMENSRHCGPGILEAKVKELTICKDAITIVIQPKDYNTKI